MLKSQLAAVSSSRGLATIGLLMLATLFIAALSRPIEALYRDVLMSAFSPFTETGREIVIVAIDEEALAGLPYRSPIDRKFIGGLVQHIEQAGPRAIGIDILFDQQTEPAKDQFLADVLERATSPVVLATADIEDGLSTGQVQYLQDFSPRARRGLAVLSRDPYDSVVRGVFPGRQSDGKWRPAFAEAVALAAGARPTLEVRDLAYLRTEDGTPFPFPTYPARAALLLPPEWFAGKFVLIGVDLPLDDRHLTPFAALNGVQAGTLPGVTIHAHILNQLLTGQRVIEPGLLPRLLAAGMCLLLAAWLAWRPLPVLLKPLILIGFVAILLLSVAMAFRHFGVLMPAIWPSVLVVGVFSAFAILAWFRDNRERQFVQQAFAQYLSPAVVNSILEHPSSLHLGGERRYITCVFTDLEGFTRLSESHSPERIADLLNEYLDSVCNLFIEHGATIDKVVGDSVVGFFGAPVTQENQSERAVSMALAIDSFSEAFRGRMKQQGEQLGATRIGIHCGSAIVGNFGGRRFFDYTAIGDTVNTASRLEGANKFLGTRLCVSSSVVDAAPSQVYRPAGSLYLYGKRRGITVYEPLPPGSAAVSYLDQYQLAYRLMADRDKKAVSAFIQLARAYPEDGLVALHRDRLASGQFGADIQLETK